jgi:hypothetical protein
MRDAMAAVSPDLRRPLLPLVPATQRTRRLRVAKT